MEDVLLHELIMGMPLLHSASKAFSEEVEGTPRPTKRGGAFRHSTKLVCMQPLMAAISSRQAERVGKTHLELCHDIWLHVLKAKKKISKAEIIAQRTKLLSEKA